MSLQSNLTLAFQRVATEFNTLRGEIDTKTGTLSGLATTAQGNLVAAINELHAELQNVDATGLIDDTSTTATDKVASVARMVALIAQAKAEAKSELIDGAGAAFDTLSELAAAIQSNDGDLAGILTSLGNRVRVDAAQTFSTAQKTQARANIDAVAVGDVGNTAQNFSTDFTGALT